MLQIVLRTRICSFRMHVAAKDFRNPSVFRSVNSTRFLFLHNRLEIQCRSIRRKGRTRTHTYKRGTFFSIVCYKSEAGNCTIIPSKWRVEDTWKAPKAHKKVTLEPYMRAEFPIRFSEGLFWNADIFYATKRRENKKYTLLTCSYAVCFNTKINNRSEMFVFIHIFHLKAFNWPFLSFTALKT